jgi:hypothetical protein
MIWLFGTLKDSVINYSINKTKLIDSLGAGGNGLASIIKAVMYSFKQKYMIGEFASYYNKSDIDFD